MKRKALLTSVLALLLCVSMLVGTTFAWFTDSVSNGINKIHSGNLDVELYHMNYTDAANASDWSVGFGIPQGETGEKVGPDTALFLNQDGEPILWEPGATAVESFRITNEGTLALKFKFMFEIVNATKTPEGKDLSDILSLYIDKITYADNGVPTGTTVVEGVKLGEGYVIEGTLLPEEDYNFWVGLEWEPSDIDNEFNVKGGLDLDVGVTLLATQFTYEKDDVNGDQYDAGAEYPEIALPPIDNAADLKDAFAAGGEFKLGADISLSEALEVPTGVEVSLDLAGYDIKADYATGEAALRVQEGGTLTIVNTGAAAAIQVTDAEGNPINGNYPAIAVKKNATLNFEDGIIDVSGFASGVQTTYGSVVNVTGGKIIVGGSQNAYGICAMRDTVVNMTGGEIVVNNGIGIFAMFGTPVTINLNAGKITVNNGSGVGSMEGSTIVNIANGFEYEGDAAKFIVDMGSNLTVDDKR